MDTLEMDARQEICFLSEISGFSPSSFFVYVYRLSDLHHRVSTVVDELERAAALTDLDPGSRFHSIYTIYPLVDDNKAKQLAHKNNMTSSFL